MKEILEHIKDQMADNLYYGASLAVYDKGQWQEHYLGTIDGQTTTQPGLTYDLASVSKVVGVGTLVVFLLNQGILDLDKPLTTYYPAFHTDELTLRQLLTHSSGIDPFIPNRDQLNEEELRQAINHITVTDKKNFIYTDINFLLLGFMLEEVCGKSLDDLFEEEIFSPFGMSETQFGPCLGAVPTVQGISDGVVHDPKAKVFKHHAGSAGLFSTIKDLELFCQAYLTEDFAKELWQNYSHADKTRSVAWNIEGDWIDHTGYTGPFIMVNRKEQKAFIFLTNRTFAYDDRPLWIEKRGELYQTVYDYL